MTVGVLPLRVWTRCAVVLLASRGHLLVPRVFVGGPLVCVPPRYFGVLGWNLVVTLRSPFFHAVEHLLW